MVETTKAQSPARAAVLTVVVRYFAAAAEAAGRSEETVTVAADADLADLQAELADRYGPRMAKILAVSAYLVDSELSRDPTRPVGEQVDVLPPFAGG